MNRANYDSLNDDPCTLRSQTERMQASMQGMIARSAYDAVLAELDKCGKDVTQLTRLCSTSAAPNCGACASCSPAARVADSLLGQFSTKEKRWQKKLGVQKQVLAAKEDGAQSLLSSLLMKDTKFPDKINTMKSEIDESKKDLEQTRRDLAQSVPIGKLLDAHSDTHSAQVQAETSAIALEAGRKGASQRPSRSPERGKRCP